MFLLGLVLFLCIRLGISSGIVVDYSSEEAIASYGHSGLHVVLLFHTTDARERVLNDLALPLSDKNTQLVFVLVDRQKLPDVARTYFLPYDVSDRYIMVIPPGKKNGIHVAPTNIPYTIQGLSHLFTSMLNDGGPPQPSIPFTDARHLQQRLAATRKNVVAAFCWDGSDSCKDFGLVLEGTVTAEHMQHIEPMVVTVHDHKDVPDLIVPSINVYDITSHQWTMCGDNLTQCLALVHPNTDSRPQRPMVHPWLSEELKEDDYIGVVTRKESPIVLPSSLLLTDMNFASHVTQYNTTVVVFCLKWSVRCKHLFLHVISAAKELDQVYNRSASLKVVSCGDYPDVCASNSISSYPTVLVFHGNTEYSYRYQGMLDVDHLLQAVGLHPMPSLQLAELRPDTLPTLYLSQPGSALVLLCMVQERAEVVLGGLPQGNRYPGLTWAWVDSQYFPLLQKLVPTVEDGSILILDFGNGKVYYNQAGPLQKTPSAFVEAFLGEQLTPDGTFSDKKWLPLQPSITFPSSKMQKKKASNISEMSHHPPASSSGHRDEL